MARSPHHAMGAGDSQKCLAECLAHSASLLYFGISVCFVFQDKAVAPLSKTPTNPILPGGDNSQCLMQKSALKH